MKRVLDGSLILPLCLSMGCSTTGGGTGADSNPNGGSGTNGGVGSSGSNGGNGAAYNPTTTGGSSPKVTGTGAPNPEAGCAGEVAPAQLTQVNILILLDKSGSMGYQNSSGGTWDHCADRWNPVVDTLNSFFSQPVSARLYASLSFLPSDGDNPTICNPNSYTSSLGLKLPLTLLDAAGQKKFSSLLCSCDSTNPPPSGSSCILPAGGTPTLPALQGTLKYAASLNVKYPDSKTVIVLITDGEPGFYQVGGNGTSNVCYDCSDLTNGCLTDATQCVRQSDEVTAIHDVIQGAPTKSIYVAGVSQDLSASTLDLWAGASGNDPIDLRSSSASDAAATLMAALQSIRSSSIQCNFDVPIPPGGATIDPDTTFVWYQPGSGNGYYIDPTTDKTAATCSTSGKNFYFDNPLRPKSITLCKTACDALQLDSKGAITVEYGCKQTHILN